MDILEKAENDIFEQMQNLRNRAVDALDEGANYRFVLCNAKISFLQSLLTDVRFARSGHAPPIVVQSVIEAVQHVEENFRPFLGTCGSECETKANEKES